MFHFKCLTTSSRLSRVSGSAMKFYANVTPPQRGIHIHVNDKYNIPTLYIISKILNLL